MTDDSETIAMRVTVIGGSPIAEIGCLLWPTSNKTLFLRRNHAFRFTSGATRP
jgi:hypothetical protein